MEARFPLGSTVITPGALHTLEPSDVKDALARHTQGDWGEVCKEDSKANERALIEGARLFSVYRDKNGAKFWIITEADRSATTILLPDEY